MAEIRDYLARAQSIAISGFSTPAHLSPEQLGSGAADAAHAVDLLQQLAHGHRRFERAALHASEGAEHLDTAATTRRLHGGDVDRQVADTCLRAAEALTIAFGILDGR